jgi:hypothetical protein
MEDSYTPAGKSTAIVNAVTAEDGTTEGAGMRDITDTVERLCRLNSDDLFVTKDDTEQACKWMYARIVALEATVSELRRQIRATEVDAAGGKPVMPVLKEIRQ